MNDNLTEIAFILDRSGSMQSLTESAISGFNSLLKNQLATPGEANLTLVLFDDEYLLHADRSPIAEARKLDTQTFVPRGCTALLDAIGRTITNIGTTLAKLPESERPGKVILAIYTDGYENASSDYTTAKIRKMIKLQTEKYNWEFLFLAANEDAMQTTASYGIHHANASQVSLNEDGMLAPPTEHVRKQRLKPTTLRLPNPCDTPLNEHSLTGTLRSCETHDLRLISNLSDHPKTVIYRLIPPSCLLF